MFLVAGWSLGLFTGLRSVATNRDRLIERRPKSSRGKLNWRLFGPYLLGICLVSAGGTGLQHDSVGYWAFRWLSFRSYSSLSFRFG